MLKIRVILNAVPLTRETAMPVYSMTGYASAQHSTASNTPENETRSQPIAQLGIEIRSVNSRFLDLGFRLPDECRGAEPALRELAAQSLSRGKVEFRAAWRVNSGAAGASRCLYRDEAARH